MSSFTNSNLNSSPNDAQDPSARQLALRLSEGAETPKQLAADLGMPLDELATRGTSPACEAILGKLARLADLRTIMIVAHYRASAAIQLIQIATGDQKDELARKACVNLLELRLPGIDQSPQDAGDDAPPQTVLSPEAEAAVQRLFRTISQDSLPPAS